MKKVFCILTCVLAILVCNITVTAVSPKNYGYDSTLQIVGAPAAYQYNTNITGDALGIGNFSAFTDLYVANEKIYISDTGNNRIVVLNSDYTLNTLITETIMENDIEPLSEPRGVFYRDGLLYICDSGNGRVVAVDESLQVRRTILKPTSSLISESTDFKPLKVAVNASGTVYIIAEGIYQGFCQYDSENAFIGFFGANTVEVTPSVIFQYFLKNIFTKQQREALIRTIPTEYANLYIDNDDMLFAVTKTASTKQVRKLNAAGSNILVYPGSNSNLLGTGFDKSNFGDQIVNYVKGNAVRSSMVDINVDNDNIMAVLDNQRGRIFLYDNELNQLCIFGGEGVQNGFFKNAISLEKNGNDYIVADADKMSVTVFCETEYMADIRAAVKAYNSGDYDTSGKYWRKVLDKNGNMLPAYKGIGRTLLNNGEFGQAMEYLKNGNDRYYYSMAVQQYRRQFIRDNFLWLLPATIAVIIGLIFFVKLIHKWMIGNERKK